MTTVQQARIKTSSFDAETQASKNVPPSVPEDAIWICANVKCGVDYSPASWAQKYCHGCRNARDKILARRFTSKTTGRVCVYCERNDAETSFKTTTECCGCYSRAQHNGRCDRCNKPLFKSGENFYCDVHNPITDPARMVKVRLFSHGNVRTAYRSREGKVHFDGQRVKLDRLRATKNGGVLMLVTRRDYVLRQTNRPLAVKGFSKALWPNSLGWVRQNVLEDLYDLAHFMKLGEATPLEFEWWTNKYKRDIQLNSAQKGWERLKERLRFLNAPFVAEVDYTGSVRLNFDKHAFINGVMKELALREGEVDVENLLKLAKVLRLQRFKAATGNVVSSCPFAPFRHIKADGTFGRDAKPSFGIEINPDGESRYNCFACSSRGDLLNLCLELGELRGVDYSELEEFIWQNEGAGVLDRACEMPLFDAPSAREERRETARAAIYRESEYEPYKGRVPKYAIEDREIPLEVCKAWDLGHDPEEGRLMFPIRDAAGNLVGLKGRSYVGARNKYFPYLEWTQGAWFYGEHMLRPEEDDPRIVIVEGEIDVIKVWMAGYSCLGIMGGMATSRQRKKLEILGRPLVLMPDANETGEKWARRLGDQMKNMVNVFDVRLKEDDPGALSTKEIREMVENSRLRL
jgi:hypothetical protein